MLSKFAKIILGTLVTAGIFGCAQQQSVLNDNWGRSFESARYNQILNPEAGKNLEPVVGLEGQAAERIMEGYISGDATKQKSSSEIGVVTIKR